MSAPVKFRRDSEGCLHKVVMWSGFPGFIVRWTSTCTGCHESEDGHSLGDYEWDDKNKRELGAGCAECGYHGKVRHEEWVPFDDVAEAYLNYTSERWKRRERLLAFWRRRRVERAKRGTDG